MRSSPPEIVVDWFWTRESQRDGSVAYVIHLTNQHVYYIITDDAENDSDLESNSITEFISLYQSPTRDPNEEQTRRMTQASLALPEPQVLLLLLLVLLLLPCCFTISILSLLVYHPSNRVHHPTAFYLHLQSQLQHQLHNGRERAGVKYVVVAHAWYNISLS